MFGADDERAGADQSYVGDVIRDLANDRRRATSNETARLRRYFARHVLPDWPNRRVLDKHAQHAEGDLQWPNDTSPEAYLESLRTTVEDPRSAVYLTQAEVEGTWTVYFVGRVRREWRGRYAGARVVVLFNAERHFWITGFQAEDGDAYVERQGGFWVHRLR